MKKSELKQLGFDYIALGHIHKLDYNSEENQRIVYPGSTISLGFDELGQHGMIVGNIEKEKVELEFIPIDNKELIIALEELEKEKGIKKEELLESIRTALITAYKRNFDALENVDVKMDEQTGATHVYAIKEVMERANDDALEISLEDARKINKELNLGDSVEVEIVPRDFGRIAAQTATELPKKHILVHRRFYKKALHLQFAIYADNTK